MMTEKKADSRKKEAESKAIKLKQDDDRRKQTAGRRKQTEGRANKLKQDDDRAENIAIGLKLNTLE